MSDRFKKKVSGGDGSVVFVKPADLARAGFTGVVAEGLFVGTLPNSFNEEVNDFKIEADVDFSIKGIDKDGQEYSRKISSGDVLILNGAGNLGYLMQSVGPGELVQISYLGKQEIEKGKMKGKLAHNFEVMTE